MMARTALTAAAVLLSVSSLALAQTSPTSPSSRPVTPAPSGSTASPGAGGSGSSAGTISGEQIKGALEQHGYSDVQVQPGANGHSVTAKKDGRQVRLNVDATGHVTQAE
jgi:hypothetical protein